MMLTLEDVDFLIRVLTDRYLRIKNGVEVAKRLEGLKKLWTKEGLPIKEVDVYLLGEVPGRFQRTQIHTFAVGDTYRLLPEDEDPEIPADGWKVRDIRAHVEDADKSRITS